MRQVKIRIVAEGKTDQLIIKELVNAYLATQSELNFELNFLNEQPTADRTSCGGWEMVYKWCLTNPPSERETIYFGTGLFANDMDNLSCDILIIHLDSDICEKIGDKTNISTPPPDNTAAPASRGLFIKQVIEGWLWPDQPVQKDKHIIAPAVEAIEAWLVAGLSHDDIDPESNHDIVKRLAVLNHTVIKKTAVPSTIKSIRKNDRTYNNILTVAKENVSRVFDRCPHFNQMVNEIIIAVNAIQ